MNKMYLRNFTSKFLNILLIFILVLAIVCVRPTTVKAANTYKQTLKSGIEAFPKDYQTLLENFVAETDHTNWHFQPYYTGIDWNEFLASQAAHGKNRVHTSLDTIYRDSCNNLASGYYCADKNATAYFMDPRNFINERNIFQFLEISYNKDMYTKNIIEEMIKGYKVFNEGKEITFVMSYEDHPEFEKEVTMTYADIIIDAAEKSKMSPISIVTKIVQEVGGDGSASVSGTNETYPSCYNFFNIGAYDTGDAILNALKYADNAGWHCPYSAIVEGAEYNSKNYIQAGQNTLYFYKFDCVGNKILEVDEEVTISSSNLYHQYMTNISDPYSQTAKYFSTYTNYNLLDKPLNFIIPVYENMPKSTTKPSSLAGAKNQDLYYAHISSSLSTRVAPGYDKGFTPITLYKDDLVIMLEKGIKDSKGDLWDKVQFWNGTTGYVVDEYLEKYTSTSIDIDMGTVGSPAPVPTPDPEETEDTIIGIGYADVSTTLNIREGAGSTYNVVGTLKAKEQFSILEETSNWYKIKTSTGLKGYVTKDYAKKLEYAKVEGNNIKITPEATADMIAQYLNVKDYTVINGDNTTVTGKELGTNYRFVSGNKDYTIIKVGDINGDAEVDVIDLALFKRYLMNKTTLEDIFKKAGKLQGDDGDIDVIDLALIKRYLLKTATIKI